MKPRRVVITGLGLLTACGQGKEPFWQSVVEGRSHVRKLDVSWNGISVKFAADIPDFEPTHFIKSRKSLKLMSREIQMAVAASHLAVDDAGIKPESFDRMRFGISLGTGIINNDLDEIGEGIHAALDEQGRFQMTKFGNEGLRALYPLWFLKYLPNMPACHISIAHGLQGPSNTITTSSAAGAQAIGEAYHIIQRGDADLMLAGGTDSKINAMGISRFHLLGLLSIQGGEPEKAYKPFDLHRDGMVLGEGAGLVVLEEMEHARKRGARIYGEVAGYGSSSDFYHDPLGRQDFLGKKLAMTRALTDAGTDAGDIDFLVANGSGIVQEDIQETQAVHSVFAGQTGRLKVTGVKPVAGHIIYGAGGVELGAAVLALHEGVIPPLANLETPDPACDLAIVRGEASPHDGRIALFNSFGFGGQNAALVIRKER